MACQTLERSSSTTEPQLPAGDPLAGQAHPPAPTAVRLRPRRGDAAAPADRPGHRARPARLLPEPGLEGPRVPVPPRRRGRLLRDRLRLRHGEQVLPGLRRPGAAAAEAQLEDRGPAVATRRFSPCNASVEDARAARRRRRRLHALRRLAAAGRGLHPARQGPPGLRPLRDAARDLGLPARARHRARRAAATPSTRSTTPRGWRWRWAPTS